MVSKVAVFICIIMSVVVLMSMMGISGTLAMAIPWTVGYFYVFWLKPTLQLEHGIRWVGWKHVCVCTESL